MKISVNKPVDLEFDQIRICVNVRLPNDFPKRIGDTWNIVVDADTGQIQDWPVGVARNVHMKVVDEGSYYLLANGHVIASLENEYVPSCVPGSYGDYIELNIDETGKITNWDNDPSLFQDSFFKDDE